MGKELGRHKSYFILFFMKEFAIVVVNFVQSRIAQFLKVESEKFCIVKKRQG